MITLQYQYLQLKHLYFSCYILNSNMRSSGLAAALISELSKVISGVSYNKQSRNFFKVFTRIKAHSLHAQVLSSLLGAGIKTLSGASVLSLFKMPTSVAIIKVEAVLCLIKLIIPDVEPM